MPNASPNPVKLTSASTLDFYNMCQTRLSMNQVVVSPGSLRSYIIQDSAHPSCRVKRGQEGISETLTHQHTFIRFSLKTFNCALEAAQGPSPQHLALYEFRSIHTFPGLHQCHKLVVTDAHHVCSVDGKTEVCVWLSGDGGRKRKKGKERASFGFVSRFVMAL